MKSLARRIAKWSARSAFGVVGLLPVLGCGGSGGGGNTQPVTPPGPTLSVATFSGNYLAGSLQALQSPAAPGSSDYQSAFGPIIANGSGAATDNTGGNDDGVVTPPAPGGTTAYTVAADGTFALVPGFATGGISSDGAAAVQMANTPGSAPNAIVLLRTTGAYTNASLTGSYHVGQIYGRANAVTPKALFTTTASGLATANGVGGLTVPTMNFNNAGVISTVPGGATGYSVAASGTITISLLNGSLSGGVSPDGAFVVAAGGTTALQDPHCAVLIRQSVLLTNAAFSGNYWAVGISSDHTDANRWTSFVGTVTADGAGNMNYASTTENYEGVISPNAGPDTYAVASNGTLTEPGGRVGAVSTDGRFAFLSGATTAGVGPLLFVFIRK